MIYHLLTAITNTLQTELKGQFPTAKSHWGTIPITAPITDPTKASLPLIALYPGPLQTSQRSSQQTNPSAPLPNGTQAPILATTTQEFQQSFSIDLQTQTPANLEKFSSLVIGILLTHQETLINIYNNTYNNTDSPPTYQAQHVTTRHHLRQFQFLSGTPTYPSNHSFGLTLTFSALGHLTLSKPVIDGGYTLKDVKVEVQSKDLGGSSKAKSSF